MNEAIATSALQLESQWKPYPTYKKSREEWIGEIPEGWEISKLGAMASVKARLGWKGLKASEYVDEGYIFLSTPNIKTKDIDFKDVNYITAERYYESPEIMLQEDDVLIAKDGSTLGITNVVRFLPEKSTVNSSIAVIRPRVNFDSIYLYYFFSSHFIQSVIQRMKDGMGVPHLFQADLRKFVVLNPPLWQQHAIANFLDRETAQIDTLIAQKERLIELLTEKRTALISHAVTKGLDPNVPMKDSGVEWIGEIPAHWKILPFRRLVSSIEQGWSPSADDRIAEENEWGVIKISAVSKGVFKSEEHKALPAETAPEKRYEIRPGDFLLTRANTPDLVADVCLVRQTRQKLMLCDLVYRITTDDGRADKGFLTYWFLTNRGRFQIKGDARGSSLSMVKVSQGHIKSWLIPILPLLEQRNISDYLDRETAKIDALITKVREHIEKLREYRTAIISAAVTGKIDVRPEVS